MDPRISRWAKTLVNYCLSVQPGETVLISAGPVAEPLVAEVYREVLRAGGHPIPRINLSSLTEILLREGNDEQLAYIDPSLRLLAEQANCRLHISSETNTRYLTNVDPARQAIAARAMRELGRIRSQRSAAGEEKWCGTLYPTQAYAQDADMSLADFQEFVYEACFLNSDEPAERWRELGREQQFYVDWLVGKDKVHVVGPDTDLRLSIAGRTFRNSDGKRNFPSGEFFTGPVEDSVEGTIRFTIPTVVNGHLVQDVRLTFECGKVVEAKAATGQQFLDQMLEMDEGARFVGEFAVGNNFGITRGIRNILYDEKIGGTIHMALGNSYPETGGKNVSALHWDMICDLREPAGGGEVYVDGTLFLKDGKLMLGPNAK
ncbi:MAG: Aminopeptidase [Ktedonobacterales bacterium]|jgi:aminopeptidase|nr:MAG: Aminopeptidase [Ktedonobacterales bacterium]